LSPAKTLDVMQESEAEITALTRALGD
jgi:hypothetical protein